MRKAAQAMCLMVVLGLMVIGCGKKSGLEGKVVDGKGNPIAGVKIVAKQVPPIIKGYEQFEATTGADGMFKFSDLYPASVYVLWPWMQDTKFSVISQSGPKGETVILPKPFAIRFAPIKDGIIIKDSMTGLQWMPDRGRKDITWDEAQAYVQGLKTGGFSDWRLPTRAELKSLYDPSITAEYKIDPMFQLSACCPWTGELGDSSSARPFDFSSGYEYSNYRSASNDGRVLAVRSPR